MACLHISNAQVKVTADWSADRPSTDEYFPGFFSPKYFMLVSTNTVKVFKTALTNQDSDVMFPATDVKLRQCGDNAWRQ